MRIPNQYVEVLKKSKGSKSFMGVSIGKKLFEDRNVMEQYALFMSEHFSESYFLIADLPKRFNLMAIDGLSENEAVRKIEKSSGDLAILLDKIVRKYENVSVKRWGEVIGEVYWENLRVLIEAYYTDDHFRKDCDLFVLEFLSIPGNKAKIISRGLTLDDALKISYMYFLDELAIVLAIHVEFGGTSCEIYPGKGIVQERVQRGLYDFCDRLRVNPNWMFMEVYHE